MNRPPKPARTRAVTGSRFRTARAACCLGLPEAAKLFRVTPRTIQNWESGRVRVPYAAFKLMRVLRGHELPHPAWRGFRLVGNTLWTPEGHPFRPDHMAWWSLTCRMADSFRLLARQNRASGAVAEGPALGLVHYETSDTPNPDSQQFRGSQAHPDPSPDRPQPGTEAQPGAPARPPRRGRVQTRSQSRRHPGTPARATTRSVRFAPTSGNATASGGEA